jgi:hypothetical protein
MISRWHKNWISLATSFHSLTTTSTSGRASTVGTSAMATPCGCSLGTGRNPALGSSSIERSSTSRPGSREGSRSITSTGTSSTTSDRISGWSLTKGTLSTATTAGSPYDHARPAGRSSSPVRRLACTAPFVASGYVPTTRGPSGSSPRGSVRLAGSPSLLGSTVRSTARARAAVRGVGWASSGVACSRKVGVA